MLNVRKASENMPIWQREKRQPTRAELADKHAADGGGMGSSVSGNSLPDDVADEDTETVELEGLPGTFVKRPKAPANINVKRYNT